MAEAPLPVTAPIEQQKSGRFGLSVRRTMAGFALAMATGLGAGGHEVTDPVETELGPNLATVDINPLQTDLVIDAGIIGKAYGPSPLRIGGWEVGVEVDVGYMPNGDHTSLGLEDLAEYQAAFFTQAGREANKEAIKGDLAREALKGFGVGFAAGAAAMAVYYRRSEEQRRRIREAAFSKTTLRAALAAACFLALNGPLTYSVAPDGRDLSSLGMEGWRFEGKLLETVGYDVGPKLVDRRQELDEYYAGMWDNLGEAYNTKLAEERLNQNPIIQKLDSGVAHQFVVVADGHCNMETAAIAAKFANKIDALGVLDLGDTTMSGTVAEKLCVSIIPKGFDGPVLAALGNHDDPVVTAEQYNSFGNAIVLNERVVKVEDYRFYGAKDVQRSSFGTAIRQLGEESPLQQGERLAEDLCAEGGANIVMMHNPEAMRPIVESGCADIGLSGHTHNQEGPETVVTPDGETAYWMINGTTGGAAHGRPTLFSELGQEAAITILITDAGTKKPIATREVTIRKDGTVSIGDPEPLQAPASAGAPPSVTASG